MTPLEAMKEALDALENNTGEFRIEGAKNILRETIEQMEKAEPVAWLNEDNQTMRYGTLANICFKFYPEYGYTIPLFLHPQGEKE